MFVLNSRFLTQNLTGVQRYAFELFKQVNKRAGNVEYVLPSQPINERYEIAEDLNLRTIGKYKSHIWEQLELPAHLNKMAVKPLLVNLCNTAPLFYKNQIVTVHDVAYMRGNWHSRSFRTLYKVVIPAILKNSKHIITVSEFSKKEIMEVYKTPGDKISVVYNAGFSELDIEKSSEGHMELKRPYILSVGSIDQRKNLKRLIKAFLGLTQADLTLYLIGAYNSNFKTDAELDALLKENSSRIVFLGYRTDGELIYLYQNALCFAYPSLYEGFGLPPIEAMSNNCPVITSNVSSLPEICGNAALYCDPFSISDIMQKLEIMIGNAEVRETCILKGRENSKKYSWEISGQALMDIVDNHL
jgi:glycosyltransferase involved in cell wall biosynthesis